MDNKTILDNRWRYTDMKLRDYLKIYKKISSKTQDKIQDIFNSIDFEYTDLNKPISSNQKKKVFRIIEEWKESNLLNGYFEYKVNELIKKRYITNQEMLDILLWGAFIKERNQMYHNKGEIINGTFSIYHQGGICRGIIPQHYIQ